LFWRRRRLRASTDILIALLPVTSGWLGSEGWSGSRGWEEGAGGAGGVAAAVALAVLFLVLRAARFVI
jgi:hypothetical protein